MRFSNWWLMCLSALLVAACSTEPASMTQATPFAAASEGGAAVATQSTGVARCYTPTFTFVGRPVGPFRSEATLSGDLEGSVAVEFDPGSNTFTGATIRNSGVMRWQITGGIIPDLSEFETSFENTNIATDRPGSPPTVFENIGRHRALSGVDTANLTYHGVFTAVPTPQANHRYEGVICP